LQLSGAQAETLRPQLLQPQAGTCKLCADTQKGDFMDYAKGCSGGCGIGIVRVAIASLAFMASMSAMAQTATVSDSTFLDANWTLTAFSAGNVGSVAAAQSGAIGNPAPSRVVSDTVAAAPSGSTESVIMGVSIYTPFTYNPAVSGAIGTINYSEDAACTSGCFGAGQSTGPALLQGGNYYVYIPSIVTGPGLSFAPHAASGLTANDFGLVAVTTGGQLANPAVHPNFSSSGLPIQFGFLRANGSSNGGAGYTLAAAIDNWQISIFAAAAPPPSPGAAIPTLGELQLIVLASLMALLGFAYLRRTRR
jgi:hypothetical protein